MKKMYEIIQMPHRKTITTKYMPSQFSFTFQIKNMEKKVKMLHIQGGI